VEFCNLHAWTFYFTFPTSWRSTISLDCGCKQNVYMSVSNESWKPSCRPASAILLWYHQHLMRKYGVRPRILISEGSVCCGFVDRVMYTSLIALWSTDWLRLHRSCNMLDRGGVGHEAPAAPRPVNLFITALGSVCAMLCWCFPPRLCVHWET